ncbi:YCF48-related protein [Thauera sinica]|uniref:YCF48-related protein n=1 Tax=Thauera sinica TaxID=2665146 RepID=A0ABW1ATW8_9RHOO|nr:YCF48-related protein [Thauera sp. K11]ATE62053.1 glycosyl hydrolase [Thauera sp. K11]
MDRISSVAARELASQAAPEHAPPQGVRHTAIKIAVSSVPWIIIGGLLWAGLFIKPQPVGGTVQPPVIERRDHYFGVAPAPSGGIWVAGSGGKIVAIDAAGRAERLPTPTAQTLQDIAVWDAQHAVAVGNDGVVLVTADGGASWRKVDGTPRSDVANKLTRVRVAGGGRAIATGEMGALLHTADYGATWSRLREEEDVAWNDAAMLPDGRIVVVGEFGRILLGTDGSADWTEPASPVESSLMSVAFRDAREGVAVGLEGVVLVSHDGGATWSRAALDSRDHLFDVAWDEANQRWLGAGALGGWVGTDAGGAWQAGRLDERDLAWHTRVLPAGKEAWFAGANVGRWDGRRWSALGH